jgi:arabinan endo-1,5-alpha-L-arabinosidase
MTVHDAAMARDWSGFVVLTLAVACSGSDKRVDEAEPVGELAQPITAGGSVLGFEDSSGWQGPGLISLSPLHTEGTHSLAVRPVSYSVYTSRPFEATGQLRSIALDIQLPAKPPNPYWYGALQVYLTCAEKQVFNSYVGQVELTGRPLDTFITLELAVPPHVRASLGSGCGALRVALAINAPGRSDVYLLDNLRLRTELLAHYEFNDGGARVTDTSGYDRHGTLVGGAVLADDPVRGPGLSLNGTSAYAELPNGILDAATEVTVATWVKLSQQGSWSRLFDFGGPNGFLYLTPSTHDGLLRYSAFTASDREGTVTAPALPVGAWKHVAVTARGREYRLYVDGAEAGSALGVPVSPAEIGSGLGQWIGRSRFPDPFLGATLDDFRIYDRALGQSEIAALARPQGDYAHYDFEESSGVAILDRSQLGLHATLIGPGQRESGRYGQALRLSGGHVQLPAAVVQGCRDFTFAAWAKLRQNRPWNRVFDFGNPDFSSFMFLSPAGFGAAGQELRFALVTPVGAHDLGFPFLAPVEEWTHLGVVISDQTATLYLNGRAAASRTGVTSDPSDMGATLQNNFGKSLFPDPTFDGALDDVRFSCRAFHAREMGQLGNAPLPAQLPSQRPLSGALTDVHDPSIIATSSGYYLFSTGPGLLARRSPDLTNVTFTGSVFSSHPAWVQERFGAIDSLWAPDISYFGGTYHLYYSASTFGSNRSCIGHATKTNLASAAPWLDQGPVICSNMDGSVDDWNAIDPNVVIDPSGAPWLSFGSFWGGLQLIPLTPSGARLGTAIHNIARGPGTAVEAPYIVYRAPYYYLFASFDFCCRGVNSTYRTVVGRSTAVTGPYLDRTGLPMLQAGGTPVVSGSSRFRGPGHNAVLQALGQTFNVYHAYDASNGGIPTLRISQLVWQDGWPVSAEP